MGRAQGVRIGWEDVPLRIRDAIEERLGGRVADIHVPPGGFSPGLAARLTTDTGSRAFVKAGGPEINPVMPAIHRREARVVAGLPSAVPAARLLWTVDEGEAGWIVLAFEDVGGRLPAHPWRADELERVVTTVAEMHEMLTPTPVDVPLAGDHIGQSLRGWTGLRGDEEGLDPWSRRNLERLQELEQEAPEAAAGEGMIHLDLRADNIVLTDDAVVVVDWPWAAVGAAWVDMLTMAPSVALEGGPAPETFFAMHPAARAADPRKVNAVLAALAGYFTSRSRQPPPPGLPTVRAFQAAQGEVARRWLAERLDLR